MCRTCRVRARHTGRMAVHDFPAEGMLRRTQHQRRMRHAGFRARVDTWVSPPLYLTFSRLPQQPLQRRNRCRRRRRQWSCLSWGCGTIIPFPQPHVAPRLANHCRMSRTGFWEIFAVNSLRTAHTRHFNPLSVYQRSTRRWVSSTVQRGCFARQLVTMLVARCALLLALTHQTTGDAGTGLRHMISRPSAR